MIGSLELRDLLLVLGIAWLIGATLYFLLKGKKKVLTRPEDVIAFRSPFQINLVIEQDDSSIDTSVFSNFSFTMDEIKTFQREKASAMKKIDDDSDATLNSMRQNLEDANSEDDDDNSSGESDGNKMQKEIDLDDKEESKDIDISEWDDDDAHDALEAQKEQEEEEVRNSVDDFFELSDHFNV